MYEPYDYGEQMDEGGYRVKPYRRPELREDIISGRRGGLKKQSRWVFISRKADIGIILVLLLSAGLCIMWFVSQLPVFVESASYHYHWAKDVYATWGTPSMRWLFINVVVGVIVATSGLLSAFGGGDSSEQHTDSSVSGIDKGVSLRGSDASVTYGPSRPLNGNLTEARFTGQGYESPLYNPYSSEPVRDRLHHESSFREWNNRGNDSSVEENEARERYRPRGVHAGANAPVYARPVDPEVMRAARPVSRQGSQRRGIPTPAEDVPMSREIPREMAFDTPPPRDMPGESFRDVPRDMPRELPRETTREVPGESFRGIPRDLPPVEEPPPSRETPVSREIPAPPEAPDAAEDTLPPSPAPAPEPEVSEGTSHHVGGSRKEDAIEIISKVYDPVPELEEVGTDPGIQLAPIEEASAERSPARREGLHKSHTFTIGRVIRRDQFADFLEPLSRKLEGIGRKVRDPHKRSDSQVESVSKSRDLPAPPSVAASNSLPVMQASAIEAGSSAAQPGKHRRRVSAESIPVVAHSRRLTSESVPTIGGTIPHHVKQSSVPVIKLPFPPIVSKASPPLSPLLKQRSIVYPPALLSQASTAEEEISPPPSPPIEKAIPPPLPPHLKLPPLKVSKDADPSSITSSEKLPSFKLHAPASDSSDPGPAAKSSKKQGEKVSSSEGKKPLSGKHSRTLSTHIASTSSASTPDTGSSFFPQDEQPLMIKPRRSSAEEEKVKEGKEESLSLDKQESPSGKDDDLHQQIEDFLARFHENWRLQRQESLARYKKRLVELDE